jgi:hypothetical protein
MAFGVGCRERRLTDPAQPMERRDRDPPFVTFQRRVDRLKRVVAAEEMEGNTNRNVRECEPFIGPRGPESSRGDLLCYRGNFVGRRGHVFIAIVGRIPGKRPAVARAQVFVAHEFESDFRRRGQDQRIEVDVFALHLALADDRDFLVDDIVGRQRETQDEQDEDVASAQLARDFTLPLRRRPASYGRSRARPPRA